MQIGVLKNVTRITVAYDGGEMFEQIFERYDAFKNGVVLHLQDDGRTLKVFPRSVEDGDD